MADTFKTLMKGTLEDINGNQLYYLVPASTKTLVTEIVLCNRNSSGDPKYCDIFITDNDTEVICLIYHKTIVGNDTIVIKMNTLIESGYLLVAQAESNDSIDIYISGVEMT